MRAMIHSAPQPPGVILRHARRAENPPKTAIAPLVRTVQRAPDMCPWPRQDQPPAVFQGIVHRRTDMLVLVVVHPPTHSSMAGLGRKGRARERCCSDRAKCRVTEIRNPVVFSAPARYNSSHAPQQRRTQPAAGRSVHRDRAAGRRAGPRDQESALDHPHEHGVAGRGFPRLRRAPRPPGDEESRTGPAGMPAAARPAGQFPPASPRPTG